MNDSSWNDANEEICKIMFAHPNWKKDMQFVVVVWDKEGFDQFGYGCEKCSVKPLLVAAAENNKVEHTKKEITH